MKNIIKLFAVLALMLLVGAGVYYVKDTQQKKELEAIQNNMAFEIIMDVYEDILDYELQNMKLKAELESIEDILEYRREAEEMEMVLEFTIHLNEINIELSAYGVVLLLTEDGLILVDISNNAGGSNA